MSVRKMYFYRILLLAVSCFAVTQLIAGDAARHETITGKAAFADYSQQKPGVFRKITLADLPEPFASQSVVNFPKEIPRPADAWPQTPPGFKVELYASGLNYPR